MDVVLEAFDTFLFDRLYASVLPAFPQTFSNQAKVPNATYSSARQRPTSYNYEPASQYLSFEPSDFAYMSQWPRNNMYRQAISLYLITTLFGAVIYFVCASLSYFTIFDKATFKHPKYLKNQISMEIKQTCQSLPWIGLCTVPFFLAEVQGYSKLYDRSEDGPGMWYNILQFPIFLMFTDFFIYWIHRGLHHPTIYKKLHKAHHKWIVPTPFASHAFHPLDGFAQSVPYHVFPFLFPLQKFAYIGLFVFVNIWTVMIHDGEYATNSEIINGAACHTMHHLYFRYNYGQYTTLWDRLGGSYRAPNDELFSKEEKMSKDEWDRQAKEAAEISRQEEGPVEDRVFLNDIHSGDKVKREAKKVQ